ncbi:MFS transporter [Streptomyces sp. Ag109_G2-15]|uniref:MFS transporter n=1 Tax=Streptomyces sp. Ag109_G2-15 TaxID=1938850 RepID=UPI000BCAF719|nr:MFS transporter [Streptomyces sp. Ag109_G2-15]SOD83671.1 Predicted arabinose efflux permease, MFS family [Streptomyces sp. Ag109_G2-15]
MSTHPSRLQGPVQCDDRPSYAAVLRVPHARRTFAAALAARLCYGTVSLAVLLSVTRATGSYAVSGAVMSLFGGAAVFLMPLRASLVDRHGPRRALLPMAALYGSFLCALAALTWRPGAPAALIAAAAALAGACAPPLGPTMRALWAELVADRSLLRRAYSLDGVAEELLYVSGPALVGVLVGWAPPASGILLSAFLNVAGTCAFVTSPAMPGPRPQPRGKSPGGVRGLLPPVAVATGVGLALSGVELLVLAFAAERSYDTALVPWVLGALSAGSAVGGLVNGAVEWRSAARVRLCWFAVGLGLVIAAAGLAPGLWTLTVAMACAGAFIAPALTTAYLLADETATEGTRTRAGAWVNTGVNAGSSGGVLVTGLLIGRLPLTLCFALAGGTALVAALAAGSRAAGAARVGAAAPR